jgi:hypothetical protein
MKLWKPMCYLSLLMLLCVTPVQASAEDPDLHIAEMAVTTKIFKGNPVDSVKRMSSSSVKALYCFTRIDSSIDGETSIKHVWYYDGEKVGEYTLPVKGKSWRTYSKKFIAKGEAGSWRVEVLNSNGDILKSVAFRMN